MSAPFDLHSALASLPAEPPLVQAGAAVLRRRAQDVARELFGTPALARLVDVMVAAMRAAPGVGLAAPQIGLPLRVLVAEDTAERLAQLPDETKAERSRTVLPLLVVVNPTLTLVPGDTATFFEGCLSVRGYGALVRRAAAVSVTGFDVHGAPVSARLEGWPARILQHEYDHLEGTLYVDRMITRSLASDAELPRLAGMTVDEAIAELDALRHPT